MASIRHKTFTKRLPPGAVLFERNGQQFARWTNRRGEVREARVTIPMTGKNAGKMRIIKEVGTVVAKFRDGTGRVREKSTGCRTMDGARRKLVEYEARSEKIRSGLLSPTEERAAEHAAVPLVTHAAEYVTHLEARRCHEGHVRNVRRHLTRLVADCRFARLIDIDRAAIERWVDARATDEEPMSPRVINQHLSAITSFAHWCVRLGRLAYNPVTKIRKVSEAGQLRRVRRAITEDELGRLLRVAAVRPIAEYGRPVVPAGKKPTNPKSRRTWKRGELTWATLDAAEAAGREALRENPDHLAALERKGRERSLVYRVLFMTALRSGELRSVRVADLEVRDGTTWVVLDGGRTKNGKKAEIALRADLAGELRAWLDERLALLQEAAKARRKPIPMRLPGAEPLLLVPTAMSKIMARDLMAANIEKVDDRGMVLDIHALRKSHGTHMLKAGVPLRVVQESMRHSTPMLTAGLYTDVRLLDVAGALDALPSFPLKSSASCKPAARS